MHAKSVASALEKLVAFTSTTEWKDIPVPVQKRASLVLSDDIGAMVAARDEPELQSLQEGVAVSAGKPEATLFNGKGQKLDRYSAALANGCASDWAELDELLAQCPLAQAGVLTSSAHRRPERRAIRIVVIHIRHASA